MAYPELDRICRSLITQYRDLGELAAGRLRRWISGNMPCAHPEVLERHLQEEHLDLLMDAFWQVLPFGTGGRRGRVGYGANRLNPTTVTMTVQGHCEYLQKAFPKRPELVVVVANDVRVFNDIAGTYRFLGSDHPLLGTSSRSLAILACEIYAANGIIAYLAEPGNDSAVLTTPELSFLISQLEAVGGINVSASHNPPDDNGVKVYDPHGSQPVPPQDQHLIDAMEGAEAVASMPFETALDQGRIRAIPEDMHERYIELYVEKYAGVHVPTKYPEVLYTPLCGSGLTTTGEVLERLGFSVITPADQGPDGSFSVIPFKAPNPEVPQSSEPAMALASVKGVGLVLSSDPDADRIGLEVKLGDGSWYHFDGNQIATVLCYFLMLDQDGPHRKGLVIETLVTTKILGRIAQRAGQSWCVDDLPVGFKYVADVLKSLESSGRYRDVSCSADQLVLAAEESHGIMMVPTIKEKDATPAGMYLAALYQRLHGEGRTLLDYYIRILEELGGYDNVNRSIMMAGPEGESKKNRLMESLRSSPPTALAGSEVIKVADYWNEEAFGPFLSETDRLPRNLIQLFTEYSIITVRPSGTEPKLKFYCQLLPRQDRPPASGEELLRQLRAESQSLALEVYRELLGRIDLALEEPGLLLPDIIELDQKLHFDQQTVPQLRRSLTSGGFADLETLLSWLAEESADMTPGADPLPALRAPLGYLCRSWAQDPAMPPLLRDLEGWAKG